MSNMHAGITEISIRDFRGVEELTLTFRQPSGYPTQVGVIAGPNGSGKTSVLEACLIAGGYGHLARGKVGAAAVHLGASDYQIDINVQIQGNSFQGRARAAHSGQSIVPFAYFSSWRAPQAIGALGITAGKRGKRPVKNEQNRFLNIKQFLVNARAHQFFPRMTGLSQSRYEAVAQDINHVWNLFFPGYNFIVEPIGDDPDEGFDVYLSDSQKRLPIDVLSSGQLEIFMFAGGLAIEGFQQGIILIDEPELHLDPQWHRTFLKALLYLKPECQILIGTHSQEFFNSVMSFERHFLVPEADRRSKAWLLGFGEERQG